MLRAIWKFFITGLLCNSLLLFNLHFVMAAEVDLITQRLEMMNINLSKLTPGSAQAVQALKDINQLKAQKVILDRQTSSQTNLEQQFAHTDPNAPEYNTLKQQVADAQDQKQLTMKQVAIESKQIADRAATSAAEAQNAALRAAGVTSDVVASAALAQSTAVLNEAITAQEGAAAMATWISDRATAQRVQAKQQANVYLATICPKTHLDAQDRPVTVPCTEADIANSEQRYNVPALKAAEDAKLADTETQKARIQELKDQLPKLASDVDGQAKKIKQDMKGHIMLSVGDFKDVNNRTFADGTKKASEENQAEYDKALHADITMVILGTVTTRLMSCTAIPVDTQVPDMLIASTAGTAFVAGEVAEYTDIIAVKNNLQNLLKDIKGDPNDRQLASLEQLKATYIAIQNATNSKKVARQASQASFYNAAQAATAEAAMLVTLNTACSNEINSKVQKGVSAANNYAMRGAISCIQWAMCAWEGCPEPQYLEKGACATAVIAVIDAGTCASGGSSSVGMNASRKNTCEDRNGSGAHLHNQTTEQPTPSRTVSTGVTGKCIAIKNVGSAANSACGGTIFAKDGKGPYSSCDTADRAYEKNNVSCPLNSLDGTLDPNFYKINDKIISSQPVKNYFEIVSNLIFSSADAGMLSSMGVSKAAVVEFIKNQTPIFANAIDTQLSAPVWRSIAWTALGDLVGTALTTTDSMLDQIQRDIDQIQSIIDAVHKSIGLGSKGGLGFGSSTDNAAPTQTFEALPCVPGTNSGNCPSVVKAVSTAPAFLELPQSVQALSAKTAKVADALSQATTLSSGTIAGMNSLGSSAKAIRADLVQRQLNLQKLMATTGSPIDIAKEVGKLSNKLTDITKSGLKKSNMSAKEMNALMGGGESKLPNTGKENNLNKLSKNKLASNKVILPDATSTSSGTDSGQLAGVTVDNNKTANADGLTDEERAAQNLSDQEANSTDNFNKKINGTGISEDNGYTLFEVITNRYKKSAYKVLFKKIE